MFPRLIQLIRNRLRKARAKRRKPLYDVQNPRWIERQRSNRAYLKNIRHHHQSENHKNC